MPSDFYNDLCSRLWMTYRHNFPPIRPSAYKTDIGWGCMLRSGQSLLANTLLIHCLGREWRRDDNKEQNKEYRKIIQWFLDELSPRAPFSIHRIALLGKQLGKNIGEWFGPNTISQVIHALVSDFPAAHLSVYIASDAVYRDDVEDVISGKRPPGGGGEAVLILVAIRLGIDQLHPTYYPALKECMRLPWFVGIAGGRPNSSLYFVGLQGDDLFYLDPHFSRPALETLPVHEYTKQDLDTYHCPIPRKIHISQLDPSMMLGFYCRTRSELDAFCERITQMSKVYTPIFTIAKRAPEYDEDVRSENDFGIVSDDEEDAVSETSL
ncbi:peptidase C54 [Lichtheimia hyalospora FSU 10163]|nr:peptidase C54 [Lichtheimia hyalospora FSU 10163]